MEIVYFFFVLEKIEKNGKMGFKIYTFFEHFLVWKDTKIFGDRSRKILGMKMRQNEKRKKIRKFLTNTILEKKSGNEREKMLIFPRIVTKKRRHLDC